MNTSYRIIARKYYASSTGEYLPGDYLKDENGNTLGFKTGEAAIEYAREHEGEHIVNDKVLDWWKDVEKD